MNINTINRLPGFLVLRRSREMTQGLLSKDSPSHLKNWHLGRLVNQTHHRRFAQCQIGRASLLSRNLESGETFLGHMTRFLPKGKNLTPSAWMMSSSILESF